MIVTPSSLMKISAMKQSYRKRIKNQKGDCHEHSRKIGACARKDGKVGMTGNFPNPHVIAMMTVHSLISELCG
ncbi:hypothetical protein DU508_06635 [Pedobacter chinensis]|uniref:Uncharacterized protein n=1 Tax=Pedobacter chinensis TaxID=2282421 RepID=A0A369PWI5_9SPHI|nr:hypothetical protein DU508_06635 [Pedobacter chinensis]